MAVKIRLSRIGSKKRPFYRVVAVHERSKRTGGYLELLGTYNPLTEPHEVTLNQTRIDFWLKAGAIPSVGYLRIIGKAPKRKPRKPKKSQPEESPAKEIKTKSEEETKETNDSEKIVENPEEQVSQTPDETGPEASTADKEEKTE